MVWKHSVAPGHPLFRKGLWGQDLIATAHIKHSSLKYTSFYQNRWRDFTGQTHQAGT